MPAWLLEETVNHLVTAMVPGFRGQSGSGSSWPETISRFTSRRWEMEAVTWHTNRVVWLTRVGDAHAIGHFWDDATGRFIGWYANLQAPLRHTRLGFDTNDHTLDVLVAPDKTWLWKDEDQLADAVAAGIYTPAVAAEVRAEAERVIATLETRLPTGWETWQPDPDWPPLALPAGWDQDVH